MSIAGYFCKRVTELRMPKSKDAKSEPLIRFEGPVMSGHKSVEEQQRDVVHHRETLDESYKTVEDYDPVLRAHCRL
jgi:hypothetical protein